LNIKLKKSCVISYSLAFLLANCFIFPVLSNYDAFADEIAVRKASKENIDTKKHEATINKVNQFLSSFDTMYSKFVESSSRYASISKGMISISRPGKIKVEYISPEESMVIIKNDKVVYFDKDLDTVSYGSVDSNPLAILLYKNVSILENTRLSSLIDSNNTIEIQVSPEVPNALKDDFSEFMSLTLVFQKDPMKLLRIKRTDVNNHSVNIRLLNPKYDVKFSKDAFPYSNPRGDKIRNNK